METSSSWVIRNEDSLVGLAGLELGSADFIYADPPYKLSNGGFSVSSGKQVPVHKGNWDISAGYHEDVEFHRNWILACKQVLSSDGTIAVSGTYHSIYQCGSILQELGFRILNEIVWFKPNGAPNLSGRSFAASHETVIWASLGKDSRHTFNYTEMKMGNFEGDALKMPGKQMRSVWSIPNTPKREKTWGRHPTQKPLALVERLILACTKPNDLVVDPFCGSGTTGVASVKHGRRFIGFELDSEFAELARLRIASVQEGER